MKECWSEVFVYFILTFFLFFFKISTRAGLGSRLGLGNSEADMIIFSHLLVDGCWSVKGNIHPAISVCLRTLGTEDNFISLLLAPSPPPMWLCQATPLPKPRNHCQHRSEYFGTKFFFSWRDTNGPISLAQNIRMKFTRDWGIRIFSFKSVKYFLNTNMEIFCVPDGDCYRC